jgi:alkylated DNA repair dioxygenase AlkB
VHDSTHAADNRATWQPTLLGAAEEPGCDPTFHGARRRFLGSGAWLDVVPGWVRGADVLFERVHAAGRWSTRDRRMYDRVVTEPRLSTGRMARPTAPCDAMATALTDRYGLDLSAVSANLYRDGRDSVAWHGDTLGRHRNETVVAIVSLGEPRGLHLRPKGGGASIRLRPGHGDLVVMGGTCQRTWDHSVPKCAVAGSRISLMFREPGVF